MKDPDTGAMIKGIGVLCREMRLVLFLLVLARCGAPAGTATPPSVPPTGTPPVTATIPPTGAPTLPADTPTLVPLVTRTPVPTLTPVPTRVPESVRCTTFQPPGTEGPIWDVEVTPDGTVWVAAFRGVACLHPARKEWIAVSVGDGPEGDQVRTLTAGADGNIWLATRLGNGVYRWDGVSWNQVTSKEGLISDRVNEVSLGPDGAVWFATQEGASRWDEESATWSHYTKDDWLYTNEVQRVLFTPDGRVWAAHNEAMRWWIPPDSDDALDAWGTFALGLPLATRKAVVSAVGRLWLGQAYYDPESQTWYDTVYREIHLQGLAVDGDGGLWIARSDGAIYIPEPESSPPEEWLHLGKAQGLGGDNVTVIALERDDVVWFGTEQGVTRCFIEGLRSSAPTPIPAVSIPAPANRPVRTGVPPGEGGNQARCRGRVNPIRAPGVGVLMMIWT